MKLEMPVVHAALKAVVTGGRGYGISHRWDGTVLTVSSDSGSSAADLVGPCGPAGRFADMTEVEKTQFAEDVLEYMDVSKLVVVGFWQREDGIWLADKTMEELRTAIEKGHTVVCEQSIEGASLRGQLIGYSEELMVFGAVFGTEGYYFALLADGTVEFTPMLLDTDNVELFPVTVTEANGVYAADRSFQEINEQINMGNVVVCDFVGTDSKTRCPLINYTAYSATFVLHSVLGSDAYFHITADGVSHMAAESEDAEETPTRVQTTKSGNEVTVMAYYDSRTSVTVITLNDAGDPVLVTKDGIDCALDWSGFDE